MFYSDLSVLLINFQISFKYKFGMSKLVGNNSIFQSSIHEGRQREQRLQELRKPLQEFKEH